MAAAPEALIAAPTGHQSLPPDPLLALGASTHAADVESSPAAALVDEPQTPLPNEGDTDSTIAAAPPSVTVVDVVSTEHCAQTAAADDRATAAKVAAAALALPMASAEAAAATIDESEYLTQTRAGAETVQPTADSHSVVDGVGERPVSAAVEPATRLFDLEFSALRPLGLHVTALPNSSSNPSLFVESITPGEQADVVAAAAASRVCKMLRRGSAWLCGARVVAVRPAAAAAATVSFSWPRDGAVGHAAASEDDGCETLAAAIDHEPARAMTITFELAPLAVEATVGAASSSSATAPRSPSDGFALRAPVESVIEGGGVTGCQDSGQGDRSDADRGADELMTDQSPVVATLGDDDARPSKRPRVEEPEAAARDESRPSAYHISDEPEPATGATSSVTGEAGPDNDDELDEVVGDGPKRAGADCHRCDQSETDSDVDDADYEASRALLKHLFDNAPRRLGNGGGEDDDDDSMDSDDSVDGDGGGAHRDATRGGAAPVTAAHPAAALATAPTTSAVALATNETTRATNAAEAKVARLRRELAISDSPGPRAQELVRSATAATNLLSAPSGETAATTAPPAVAAVVAPAAPHAHPAAAGGSEASGAQPNVVKGKGRRRDADTLHGEALGGDDDDGARATKRPRTASPAPAGSRSSSPVPASKSALTTFSRCDRARRVLQSPKNSPSLCGEVSFFLSAASRSGPPASVPRAKPTPRRSSSHVVIIVNYLVIH